MKIKLIQHKKTGKLYITGGTEEQCGRVIKLVHEIIKEEMQEVVYDSKVAHLRNELKKLTT